MTYKVSSADQSAADALLEPGRLYPPADLRADMAQIPAASGVYAVWLDACFPDLAPAARTSGVWMLSYIGIAQGRRGLRGRLSNHFRGPCRSSTLRRALAALLRGELGLSVSQSSSGKLFFDRDGEAKLSAWIDQHARIVWAEHEAPAKLEAALLKTIATPLNVDGAPIENTKVLKMARSRLKHAAQATPIRRV